MNAHSSAHEIPKVPSLFIDAFKGKYLANKTTDARNTFVLTHYHGDHYGSLPRDHQYKGPALIHCTTITARLLRRIHGVPEAFVVEHAYGATWSLSADGDQQGLKNRDDADGQPPAVEITFYDANHCPGAAIVVVELPDKSVHVHTGDFRYHPRMQMYPVLRDAALNQRIESILLDTTYGHPKHTFASQDVVVESIADQVKSKLDGETLILLECYNVGKEKILWATANACQQSVYVSERKWNLLECLASDGNPDSGAAAVDACHEIITKCTRDPLQSSIHVVPMSTSGELWPFYQPNYESIAEYVEQQQQYKKYKRVVSFIPTGWAEASNWNKKHASTKMTRRGLDIEIQLVAYSEHSSFTELQEFVKFTKPMRVVATVYKDEKDKRNIEARFGVDRTRAKKRFLEQMARHPTSTMTASASESLPVESSTVSLMTSLSSSPSNSSSFLKRQALEIKSTDEIVGDEKLSQLVSMGFAVVEAQLALEASHHDVDDAIGRLLQGPERKGHRSLATASTPPLKSTSKSSPTSLTKTTTKLTAFFKRREK